MPKKTKRVANLSTDPCLVKNGRGFLKEEELADGVSVGDGEVEGGLQELNEAGEELFLTVSLLHKLF